MTPAEFVEQQVDHQPRRRSVRCTLAGGGIVDDPHFFIGLQRTDHRGADRQGAEGCGEDRRDVTPQQPEQRQQCNQGRVSRHPLEPIELHVDGKDDEHGKDDRLALAAGPPAGEAQNNGGQGAGDGGVEERVCRDRIAAVGGKNEERRPEDEESRQGPQGDRLCIVTRHFFRSP
jgi:hypothetical protein